MKTIQLKLMALVICYFLGIQNTLSQNQNNTTNTDIDILFEKYNNNNTPGIAVSVSKDGEVVYQKEFGMANLEYEIPITEKTKFHAASLSKQFTAFLILKLEDEGLLSINDDVRTYIPELPDYGNTITINHLLTHSSGIRDQWRLLELAGWRMDDVIKTEQVFKLITNQKELNFVPGDNFKYSNSGYTLLAIIVERLTKTSFANYAKQIIFKPLQMSDSFFYDDHEVIVPNRAYSYKKVNDKLKKSNLNFATVGPTSLFTTTLDMNKWAQNFKTRTIGNERIFQSMNQKAQKNDGTISSYAKGQFVKNYKGYKMIYHSGSDAGYRCYFARFPELGYEFSLFANASYISAYDEIFKLIDYYLQDQYPSSEKDGQSSKSFQYDDNLFVNLSNAEIEKFEGTYFDREQKQYWKVQIQNDTLYCKGGIIPEAMKLHPVGKKNFKIKGTPYDISVNFKENDYNEPILEFRIPDIIWLWLIRVKEVNTSDYLGSYYNNELNVEYELVKKENELYLTHQKLDDIKIEQINRAYFSSNNRNFSNIRFKRNNAGKVVEFSVSNGSIENITFSRK
ncbi:serine hydrolase domain-containing protein [uncultured Winogradskyella sp.]|uniref:serine hydrolase domain-containing protein n=1 Tax=uncultured Winogradskyella sp. TaxID=395353 RepID=UPI002622BA56|nr:serine hydrolase domain-containing protein [uncultured Winogradskyella sp.]